MFRRFSRPLRRRGGRALNSLLSIARIRRRDHVEAAISRQYRVSLCREARPDEVKTWADRVYEEGLGLRRVLKVIGRLPPAKDPTNYRDWVRVHDTIGEEERARIRAHIAAMKLRPTISVVMPVYNTRIEFLRAAIHSVREQLYNNWELCIADDASTDPRVPAVLDEMARLDPRIKWSRREVNGHISEASNTALALATGTFVALLDHDDILPEHALCEVAAELERHPDADIVYSDEDKIGEDGERHSPHFKPDWNPELALGCNIISHLGVYRRSLLAEIGGFRPGLEGSQDYDLALRAINASVPAKIRHIPTVLYHWRVGGHSFSQTQRQRCIDAARKAKTDFMAARHEPGMVVENPLLPTFDRILRPVPSPAPLVSLIIPSRNRADLLAKCVDGLLHRTDYASVEIIIVDHASDEPETRALLARLRHDARVRIMSYAGSFNYSAMNNLAVQHARGELLGFINNDVDVIEPGWLSEMVSLAVRPENGAVGAKLLFPNGRVQHAGIVLGMSGIAGHAFRQFERESRGYAGRLALTANVAAVTGACILVRKSVFIAVGGFNAQDLKVAFNDVDLCLKIGAAGYRNVWTPFALLYHHEMASRGGEIDPAERKRAELEVEHMRRTWPGRFDEDPFYNANLSQEDESFRLAEPPRRSKPWQRTATVAPPPEPDQAQLSMHKAAIDVKADTTEPARLQRNSARPPRSKIDRDRIRVGISGTFDVENYGDLLFPIIAQTALAARDPRIEIVAISPNRKDASSWPFGVHPATDLPELIPSLDAMLIGGGQIVRFDKHYPIPVETGANVPICYWLLPAIMAAMAGKPVIWNGVGVWTQTPQAPWYMPVFKNALMASSLIGVRDEASRSFFRHVAPDAEIGLVPDTAFSLSKLWPLAEETEAYRAWRSALQVRPPYAVVQANAAMSSCLVDIERALGKLPAVVLPICRCHGDRAETFPKLSGQTYTSSEWVPPRLVAEIIGRSELVIASSLHACITGLSYGVPVIRAPVSPLPTDRKFELLRGFDGIADLSDATGVERLMRRAPGIERAVAEKIGLLDRYWDDVVEIIVGDQSRCDHGVATMMRWVDKSCGDMDPDTRSTIVPNET